MAKRIALVEDEPAIRKNYADALTKRGYEVSAYTGTEDSLTAFRKRLPELAIIDIGLGDDIEGGFEVCRVLRGMSATLPIIFLTARDSDFDAISGLRLGADDYLTKDVSIPQILARVAALFRRLDALQQEYGRDQLHIVNNLAIDKNCMTVEWKGQRIDLTLTEFWIVHSLARIPGHVKNRDQLMKDADIFVDDGTVTSHVKRIRRKFEDIDATFDRIDTVYGMGYRWKI
ncbi:MAG: proteobacterial dedicated sortase system response regulator [Gammaproteobacteria bacterium RIFCSPLOWO2_12_FULL_52_10]|nr:MAG: proteobacterial dedicated sortase system response regulator [Gammaproteobacteria bacterium RIFCSPLOWO2_12_FULL_52_10]